MFNLFETAENLSGIPDPTGITVFHPADPAQDCDECNSSYAASNLIPFPWKERFKSQLNGHDVRCEVQFNVCGECHDLLKGVRQYDTALVDEPETDDDAGSLPLAA